VLIKISILLKLRYCIVNIIKSYLSYSHEYRNAKNQMEDHLERILWMEFLGSEISTLLDPTLTVFSIAVLVMATLASISSFSIPHINTSVAMVSAVAIIWLFAHVVRKRTISVRIGKLQELQKK